jgi:outer membrane protein
VFDSYQRTKDLETGLERKGRERHTQLEGQFKELKQLRQNLELVAEGAREAKVREIEEKSDTFSRLKTRSERELVTERNQLAREILEEIDQAVSEYAKANGFSVILDQRAVLYGQDGDDVTEAVVRLLNERYQSRTAGARR